LLEETISLGIFTSYENNSIDAQIAAKLQLITKDILENIFSVRSILLTGGFGKGEGSIKKINSGKIICLRDFDLVVIVDKIPNEIVIRKLYKQIYQSLNLPNPESTLFRFSNFVVDIKFLCKKDLIYPDIWFYDLKTASNLLYGEDIRTSMSCSKEEIPLSSGLRILFEKVAGLLALFPYVDSNLDKTQVEQIPEEEKNLIIFECYKAIIEMCTVLCILANRYEPKYAERARIFKDFYYSDFPEIAEVLPDLPKKVMSCTLFKLKPDFTEINEDVIDLWFSTRNSLGIVLNFYIKKYLGTNTFDLKNFPDYIKRISRSYYKPFLKSLISTKKLTLNGTFLSFVSFLYQFLTNIEYSYVVIRDLHKLHLQPLTRWYVSPSLKFFASGVLHLFSLNKDRTVNKGLLQKAKTELSHCIPVEISTINISNWYTFRKLFQKAYNLYRGYHFVK